jgi:hypothetical protein
LSPYSLDTIDTTARHATLGKHVAYAAWVASTAGHGAERFAGKIVCPPICCCGLPGSSRGRPVVSFSFGRFALPAQGSSAMMCGRSPTASNARPTAFDRSDAGAKAAVRRPGQPETTACAAAQAAMSCCAACSQGQPRQSCMPKGSERKPRHTPIRAVRPGVGHRQRGQPPGARSPRARRGFGKAGCLRPGHLGSAGEGANITSDACSRRRNILQPASVLSAPCIRARALCRIQMWVAINL